VADTSFAGKLKSIGQVDSKNVKAISTQKSFTDPNSAELRVLGKDDQTNEVERNNGSTAPMQVMAINDACGSATPLVIGVTASLQSWGSTNNIITTPTCWTYGGNDVWYTFTVPSGPSNYNISITASANVKPELAVYKFATACSAAGATQVTCNDYYSGTGANKTISIEATCLAAGTYYIEVDCAAAASGNFSILVSSAASGPSNDCCTNAYAIPTANLNGTWNTGFTTVGATYDSYYSGTPCNYASNNVWFSFVAQGPNVEVTVAGTSTSFEPEINVYNATCSVASASVITCNNLNGYLYSSISAVNNAGPNLVTGNTYYVMVTNEGTAGTFSIQINNPAPNPAGTDCATAALVCSNSALSGGSNLWGNQELTTNTIGACLGQYGEINSTWYVLNVLTGGTLTFTISPTNGTDDFDYSIWKGSTCTLGAPVRCNYSSTLGNTGLNTTNTNTTANATGSPFDQYITAASGDVYIVLVNGYNPNSNIYNLSFGGSAVLGCTLPVVLPIELLNFSANLNGQAVDLNWSTSSETNNSYFTIERSADGRNFEELTKVKGAGTSKGKLNYNVIDYSPLPGVSYYRLSQTDMNGKMNLLTITSVNNTDNDGMFKVIPNPTDGIININYSCGTATSGVLNMYDGNGLLVLSKEIDCVAGDNKTQLDLGEKAAGIYLVTFTTNDKFYRTKLIKK